MLVVAFGTILAALVPIALTLVAVAVGLGGITLLANAMEVSTVAPTIAAMIGLGVGIDYALFIMARYREHRAAGQDNPTALSGAMGSAGSAVLLAGGTVVVAMAALVLTGLGFLASIGLSTSLVVLFAVATALTLLPALLSLLGNRIDAGRLVDAGAPQERPGHGLVALRPPRVRPAVAVPGRRLGGAARAGRPGAADGDGLPRRRRRPDQHHPPSRLRPARGRLRPGLQRAAAARRRPAAPGVDAWAIPALAQRVAADPGIAMVGEPRTSPAGDTVVLPTIPTTAPADPGRRRPCGASARPVPANVAVSGLTAMTDDLTTSCPAPCPSSSPPSWPCRSCC